MSIPNRPQENAGEEDSRGLIDLARILMTRYRARALGVIALLTISGLAEGIGIFSLLPLIQIAGNDSTEPGGASGAFIDVLSSTGLEPSIGSLVGLIVVGLTLKAALLLWGVTLAGYMGADIAAHLRLDLISALVRARWSYFTKQSLGSLTNSIGVEAMRASQVATEGAYLVAASIQVLVYGSVALVVSLTLTVSTLAFAAVLFLLLHRVVRAARQAGAQETAVLRSLNSRLADSLAAIKALKAMSRERALEPVLAADTRGINSAQRRQVLTKALLPAFQEPIISIILGLGLYLALRATDAQLEEFLFLAVIFYRIATRIGNVQSYYQSVAVVQSAFWSLQNTIDTANRAKEDDPGKERPTLEERIELRGVTFHYVDTPVLTDLNLSIPARRLTTIIGDSGAGKTTIADLIVGLIRPYAGEVFVDGIPLALVDLHEWRKMIGYVPQETLLVHDTIERNVTLTEEEVDPARVRAALERAEAWEFVCSLPEGIHTVVGERGLRFSGGQRQRLSIARALFSDPKLLILDEATTALDPRTEQDICGTLAQLKRQVTMLAISHQTALADIADQVVHLQSQPHRTDEATL